MRFYKCTQSEIRYLENSILIQKQILRLQIPVINTPTVAKIDSTDQLLKVLPCLVLMESTFSYPVEKFTPFGIFYDEVNLGLGGQNLIKLQNIGVFNQFHNRYLSLGLILQPNFQNFLLVDHLNGNTLTSSEVPCMVNLCKVSLP
uniref:Uncharacterized protein n=1 Tax=Cajanus cajan TaxID=3821 RepID=A0A151U917_CAJCA|nr:hypothetical protein KK1_020016 [Cajanus cajan]